MKYTNFFLFVFCFFFGFSVAISAQQKSYSASTDSILLLNGKQFVTHIVDTLNGLVTLKNPNGNKKNILLEKDRIYQINFGNGTKKTYYKQDSLEENYFTVAEMGYFIKGEQDARKGFKPWWTTVGGGVSGFGGGLVASILAPVPVFVFFIASGIPKVRIRHETVSNIEYLKHDTYIMGYERVARSKRAFNVLKGGLIGLAVGIFVGIKYVK
ncbi:MAG: hypothetical protein ABI199_10705 [Bacteroidia bacterium]